MIKIKMAIFCTFFLSSVSYSADFDSCKVVEIVTAGANNFHAKIDCNIEPRPPCAVAGSYFGFDKSTDEGKQYMSIVLTAFSMGAKLTGYIDNTQCSPHQGNVGLLIHIRMRK